MHKVELIEFYSVRDDRGNLTSIEVGKEIDFEVKRFFYLHGITSDRGGHAHIDTDQILICMSGSLEIELIFEQKKYFFKLENPRLGLTIPRLTFVTMRNFTKDALVLVIANTNYDYSKSLRNFVEFTNYINQSNVD